MFFCQRPSVCERCDMFWVVPPDQLRSYVLKMAHERHFDAKYGEVLSQFTSLLSGGNLERMHQYKRDRRNNILAMVSGSDMLGGLQPSEFAQLESIVESTSGCRGVLQSHRPQGSEAERLGMSSPP
mmetsp:Transcript_171871/g.550808  ORF Transcript_171871/g.550808 Transcript_171871/m.550808 type:complete len:126 (-) Transcript_171871:331-708(-)